MMRPYGWRFNIYWNGAGGGDGGDGGDGTGGDGTTGATASQGGAMGGIGGTTGGGTAAANAAAANAVGGQATGSFGGGGGSDGATTAGPSATGTSVSIGGQTGFGNQGTSGGGSGGSGAGGGGAGGAGTGAGGATGSGASTGGNAGGVGGGGHGFGQSLSSLVANLFGFGTPNSVINSKLSATQLGEQLGIPPHNPFFNDLGVPPGVLTGVPTATTPVTVSPLAPPTNQTTLDDLVKAIYALTPGTTMGYPSQTPSIGIQGQPQPTPAPLKGAVDPGLFGPDIAPSVRGPGSDASAPVGPDIAPSVRGPGSDASAPVGPDIAPSVRGPGSDASAPVGPDTVTVSNSPPAVVQKTVNSVPGLTAPQQAHVITVMAHNPNATVSQAVHAVTHYGPTTGIARGTATVAPAPQAQQNNNSLMNAIANALMGSPALSSLAQSSGRR